ncbi:pentapeptide repeat protein [Stackebrandtia endophytica]|uniref:Pentapeptide repeat protein n=1 Tax=Stackebrandtia endophytica TaxID=1496996 RepID=A0A543AW06_9ACTN|nr:pentapeptide repeat-containing protein [Stackebrandtia endophytica]TQL76732.1 pentapeptide repeat protein [Stackebrandtia endophytica]
MGRFIRDHWARWKRVASWAAAIILGLGFITVTGLVTGLVIDPGAGEAAPGAAGGNLEAVRTVLTAMVGAGGLVTLAVVIRRQWSQERAHELAVRIADDHRAEADRRHRLELDNAARAEHDATERRITDLYMAAAEQLGHEKASVRLAALYALDRLGRNHEGHRREVVDIWCAYLRQPFTPPMRCTDDCAPVASTAMTDSTVDAYLTSTPNPDSTPGKEESREQEYQVRATAQHLLARHLKDPRPAQDRGDALPPVVADGYWRVDRIDLTGATLIDTDFTGCHLPQPDFTRAHFHGNAAFDNAHFHGNAAFDNAHFHRDTAFDNAHFHGNGSFIGSRFHETAWFSGTHFHETAWLRDTYFRETAMFNDTNFHQNAWFHRSHFRQTAVFNDAHFHKSVWFRNTHFQEDAGFIGADFHGDAGFIGAHFHGYAGFGDMALEEGVEFLCGGAMAVMELPAGRRHSWPPDWVLTPDPDKPGWGRLQLSRTSSPQRRGFRAHESTVPSTPPD